MSDPAPAPSSAVDHDNPWPGLSSFTEDLRSFFFGREKETDELVRLIRRNTLTVLFGQSGLGKSSLLQAGVFPLLREADFLPLYLRLDHDPATPPLADQVKAALVEAFKSVGADAPVPRADESLWEYFHRKDIDIWSAKNRLLTPVLAFDQFEEIFTLGRADDIRRERGRAFLTELADLVENRPPSGLRAKFDSGEMDTGRYNFDKPSCQVILSLREDFLPDLEGLKNEMRSLMYNRMRVCRLTGTQALEIVTRPAPQLLAEGVAVRVVEFVAGARGGSAERLEEMEVEPALLSVICRELNQRRRSLGQEAITADLVSGNRREILNDFYERSVADLPPAMREYVEDHLLTKSGFRDNLALETVLEANGVTRALVDTLVSRRLLRIEDRLGIQRVELTHDVLADVISASRDSRHEREALSEAQRLLALEKEREAATRRSLVRARSVAAVAIILMLLAAGSTLFGWINLGRARTAEHQAEQAKAGESQLREQAQANELTARQIAYAADMNLAAQALHDGNLGRAMDLIDRQRPQPGQKDLRGWEWRYLWQQARSDALATVYHGGNGEIQSLAASPDGQLLAIGLSHVGGMVVKDLATRKQVALLEPTEGVVRAAFSPTEPFLAFSSTDISSSKAGANGITRLHLWNTATRRITADLPLAEICQGIAFTGDGRTLVTLTASTIVLRRMPDGEKLAEYKIESNNVFPGTPFALSYDGTLAACGLRDGRVGVVDLNDGHTIWSAIATDGTISALAFTRDGKTLATGGAYQDPEIRLWNVATGSEIGRLSGHSSWVSSLVFWPDGSKLASSSADQTIRIWDVASRKELDLLRGHRGEVWRLALLPDGRTLASGCKDGTVKLWDISTLHRHQESITLPKPVKVWSFAPDGRSILVWDSEGHLVKWTGPTYEQQELLLDTGPGSLETFSSDHRQFVMRLLDGRLAVWDIGQRRALSFLTPATPKEYPISIFPHSNTLLTYSYDDNQCREWSLATKSVVQAWSSPAIAESGNVSPDERSIIILGVEGSAFLRDLEAQRTTRLDLKILEPNIANFSTDGRYFAVASNEAYVRVWETINWREVATLNGFRLAAGGASFSRDGKRLLTTGSSSDEAVKLWDTEGWQDVLTLSGLSGSGIYSGIAMSGDGNVIAHMSNRRLLQVWQAPSWEEIEAAEKAPIGSDSTQ